MIFSEIKIKTAFRQNFLRRSPFFEKTGQLLTKKLRFLVGAPRSKLVYFGAKGAIRKIIWSVNQKWIFQNSKKEDPLVREGGRIPEGGGGGGGGVRHFGSNSNSKAYN